MIAAILKDVAAKLASVRADEYENYPANEAGFASDSQLSPLAAASHLVGEGFELAIEMSDIGHPSLVRRPKTRRFGIGPALALCFEYGGSMRNENQGRPMKLSRAVLLFALVSTAMACSHSTSGPTPKRDASGSDTVIPTKDAGGDMTPLRDEVSVGSDLGADVAADLGVDAVLTPVDGPTADGGKSCYWQKDGARYYLKHFTFTLVTPDGQAQSPPSNSSPQDAGSWPIHDFQGQIASQSGGQLTVDSCLDPTACQPSLYRFTLCDAAYPGCQNQGSIELSIPVGRRVRVVWRLEGGFGFAPGLYWLAIYDAEPGATQGNVLFIGSGGYQPPAQSQEDLDYEGLPFSVTLKPLSCGGTARDASMGVADDYAFVFSAKDGTGTSLQVATGETGTFELTPASGASQRLQVHCLDAVQTASTDDYWNWDFWAASESAPSSVSPVDGGAG